MSTTMPKNWVVYACLGAFWVGVVAWQAAEHRRMRQSEEQLLLNHATDIATSLEVVLRSQRRFGHIQRDRLTAALEALIRYSELRSLALVNRHGEVVISTGEPLPIETGALPAGTQLWGDGILTVVELVQIAPLVPRESHPDGEGPVVVMDHPPPPPPPDDQKVGDQVQPPDAPPEDAPPPEGEEAKDDPPDRGPFSWLTREQRERLKAWHRKHGKPGTPGNRPKFPPWMTEEEYNQLVEKAGLQRFVLVLSSGDVTAKVQRDLSTRAFLGLIGLLAAAALGFGWRTLLRATDLRLRLVRAQEMNTHLREMNTAAAGLAHETRNPLNSVRGLAQLIADDPKTGDESRQRAGTVLAEVDRVNSRLGEFLSYSRPRSPNPAPVDLPRLVDDVVRTLDVDRDEKSIVLDVQVPELKVMADQGQLRQVLFNLLLNAYQATPEGGHVSVSTRQQHGEITLSIADDGPGVPVDAREDIYRPYFTLSEEGTGLGLAVARQIVLAHQWNLQYRDVDGGGAEFRVAGLRPA